MRCGMPASVYPPPLVSEGIAPLWAGGRPYLTLTQGMHLGYGGNPYGPAGTGKTESVKALGNAMGRQVLVFNCDEGIPRGLVPNGGTPSKADLDTIQSHCAIRSGLLPLVGEKRLPVRPPPKTSKAWAASSRGCASAGHGAASMSSTG